MGFVGGSRGPVTVAASRLTMNLAGQTGVAGVVGSYWVNALAVTNTNVSGTIVDQQGVGRCYYGQAVGTAVAVDSTGSQCSCGAGCA